MSVDKLRSTATFFRLFLHYLIIVCTDSSTSINSLELLVMRFISEFNKCFLHGIWRILRMLAICWLTVALSTLSHRIHFSGWILYLVKVSLINWARTSTVKLTNSFLSSFPSSSSSSFLRGITREHANRTSCGICVTFFLCYLRFLSCSKQTLQHNAHYFSTSRHVKSKLV